MITNRFGAIALSAVFVSGMTFAPLGAADSGQYVRTQSGRVRCWVTPNATICEASGPITPPWDQWENNGFLQSPLTSYGSHYHNAVVDAAGNFSFQDGGNIGAAHPENDLVLAYGKPYTVEGWSITSGPDGTRFTNNNTGHGMFVSIENVYAF